MLLSKLTPHNPTPSFLWKSLGSPSLSHLPQMPLSFHLGSFPRQAAAATQAFAPFLHLFCLLSLDCPGLWALLLRRVKTIEVRVSDIS